MKYAIKRISNLNIRALDSLARDAGSEGYGVVQKAITEWNSGFNRFSKRGEILWGVFIGAKCIAIGGLNVDPFAGNPEVGRVRRIYVSRNYRRKGIAKLLLDRIIKRAKKYFRILRLSTSNPNASNLYKSKGFIEKEGHRQTHVISLG